MKISQLLLLLAFLCLVSPLQSQTVIDSLEREIAQLESLNKEIDQRKALVDLYNKMTWELHESNVVESESYVYKAKSLSKEISYEKGYARALNLQAILVNYRGSEMQAKLLNEEALQIAQNIQDSFLISACSNDLGIHYMIIENYEKALGLLNTALDYNIRTDTLGLVYNYVNLLNVNLALNDSVGANESYLAMREIGLQSTNNRVKSTLEIEEVALLMENEEYESAEALCRKSINRQKVANDVNHLPFIMEMFGDVLEAQEKYTEAHEINLENLAIIEKNNLFYHKEYIHLELAESFDFLNRTNEAIEQLLTSIELSDDAHLLLDKYYFLIELYKNQNDFESMVSTYEKLLPLSDSLNHKDRINAIEDYKVLYHTEKKTAENQKLKMEQMGFTIQLDKRQQVISLLIVLSLLLVLSLFYFFNSSRKEKKFAKSLKKMVEEKTHSLRSANETLKDKNEELEKFNYIAAHDLKTPLRTIISFNDLLVRKLGDRIDAKEIEYLGFIKNSANWMHELLEDLLKLSNSDKENEYTLFETEVLINEIGLSLNALIEEKNASMQFVEYPKTLNTDKIKVEQILQNLISNGIKFSKLNTHPKVEVRIKEKEDRVIFSVEDNGIGLDQEYFDSVFEPFKRLNPEKTYEGTGIGLAICAKLANKLGGSIWVVSKKDKGSCFSFEIPKKGYVLNKELKDNTLLPLDVKEAVLETP